MDKVIAILAVDHVYYSTFSESDWCSLPYYQCLLTDYPKHTHENSQSGYLAGFLLEFYQMNLIVRLTGYPCFLWA